MFGNTLYTNLAFNDSYVRGENNTLFGGYTQSTNESQQIPIVGEQTSPELVDNYNGNAPVSFQTWQQQLSFNRDGTGQNNETHARNSGDARHWYDNYVQTWNAADQNTRNAIDIQHGFAFDPPPAPPPPPTPAAPPVQSSSVAEPYVERIEEAAEAPREEITPVPGDHDGDGEQDEGTVGGLEDTTVEAPTEEEQVEDRDVYSPDFEEDEVVNNNAPITPADTVVDPATGQQYDSPAAARAAGITNWVYLDDWEG